MMVAGNTTSGSKYQIKHRVIGAAILVGLAVLIISGLLGKSFFTTQKSTLPVAKTEGAGWQSSIQGAGEQAPLANQAPDAGPGQLDNQGAAPAVSDSETNATELESRTTIKPVVDTPPVDGAEVTATAPDVVPEKSGASSEQAAVSPASPQSTLAERTAPQTAAAEAEVPATADAAVLESGQPVAQPQSLPAPEKASPAPAQPVQEQVREDSWVVRVGTFAKKQNAESVSDLLRSKGYSPNRIEVDTKVGRATRIWLGPYSERDEASRVSSGLKEITGEKGYVTRTAS